MTGVSSRAPFILRVIAVLGVVVATFGTVVVWQFLGDLEETTESSLEIGEQLTVTLIETIDLAEQVLVAVDGGLVTVESALDTIGEVLQSTAGLAEATGSLAATLPESFGDIDVALNTVQTLGETVDRTLSALALLPFGPDYDPEVPFPEAIAGLREALVPIATDLTAIAGELQDFAAGSGELTAEIDALAVDVGEAREALTGFDSVLDQYRQAAEEVGQLAAESHDNLARSMDLTRIVLLALGGLLVISQYIPWTLAAVIRSNRQT